VKIKSDRLFPIKKNSDRLFPFGQKKAIAPLPLARKKRSPLPLWTEKSDRPSPFSQKKAIASSIKKRFN
jgi:hypothetical protein